MDKWKKEGGKGEGKEGRERERKKEKEKKERVNKCLWKNTVGWVDE